MRRVLDGIICVNIGVLDKIVQIITTIVAEIENKKVEFSVQLNAALISHFIVCWKYLNPDFASNE